MKSQKLYSYKICIWFLLHRFLNLSHDEQHYNHIRSKKKIDKNDLICL